MSWRAQGLRAWLLQRLTAVYITFYIIGFMLLYFIQQPNDHYQWRAFFSSPLMNVASVFFFAAIFFHAWVGVRDILVDYVKPQPVRFTAFVLMSLMLMGLMIWVTFVLFGVFQG